MQTYDEVLAVARTLDVPIISLFDSAVTTRAFQWYKVDGEDWTAEINLPPSITRADRILYQGRGSTEQLARLRSHSRLIIVTSMYNRLGQPCFGAPDTFLYKNLSGLQYSPEEFRPIIGHWLALQQIKNDLEEMAASGA